MNEELSENVALEDNAEEKNREVYRRPVLKKIDLEETRGFNGRGSDMTTFS